MAACAQLSNYCTLGGTTAAVRNLISGNNGIGVKIRGIDVVQGNFIGTDVTGTLPLGNASYGVYFDFSVSNATVGGTAAGRETSSPTAAERV